MKNIHIKVVKRFSGSAAKAILAKTGLPGALQAGEVYEVPASLLKELTGAGLVFTLTDEGDLPAGVVSEGTIRMIEGFERVLARDAREVKK